MYGVPIVAAASEGPSSLIEDGVTGLLVPVDDGSAMAKAVARLAGEPNLATGLAAAGRRQYECHYTEEIILPKYLNLFERLTG